MVLDCANSAIIFRNVKIALEMVLIFYTFAESRRNDINKGEAARSQPFDNGVFFLELKWCGFL